MLFWSAFPLNENLEPEALDEISLKVGQSMEICEKNWFSQVIGQSSAWTQQGSIFCSFEGVPSKESLELEGIDEASLKVCQSMEISKETVP